MSDKGKESGIVVRGGLVFELLFEGSRGGKRGSG